MKKKDDLDNNMTVPEMVHYMYSRTAKKFKALDIIICPRGISLLFGDGHGNISQTSIFDAKQKKKIIDFYEGLLNEKNK